MVKFPSIIVLTYNNLDHTRRCLESLYAKPAGLEFELIIVDNASQDGTPAYLREFAAHPQHPNCRAILNASNLGFSAGNNVGAAAVSPHSDGIVFLNNDTVVTAGWLAALCRPLADPQVGMTGAVTNVSGNFSRIPVTYNTTDLSGLDDFAAEYARQHAGQVFEVSMMPFQCVALRRRVFEEIGPLDERFGIGMFEDDDYAMRLRQAGYRIWGVEDAYIHHYGSASFSRLERHHYMTLFQENLCLFEKKWNVRWMPGVQRPEFVPEHLRQLMDGMFFWHQAAQNWEQTAKEHLEHARQLQIQLQEMDDQRSKAIIELKSIYASNGWLLLQQLWRLRRYVAPEGSRREQFVRFSIQTLRSLKTNLTSWGAVRPTAGLAFSKAKRLLHYRRSAKTAVVAPFVTPGVRSPEAHPGEAAPRYQIPLPGSKPFAWPLVSVLLPVYNHADMLPGAAQSVLNSTYPNLELVILDDGSTDAIDPVLRRLSHHPQVRIYRQPNQKLPRALTHAHQFARGQFITWISADNLYAPQAITCMAETLLAHPETVLVYADVAVMGDAGQPLRDDSYRHQNQDRQRKELIRLYRSAEPLGYEADNYINACFLYRQQAAQALEGVYADDLRGLEDYDFWLRLQKIGQVRHVGNREPLYYYRVHKRTMSHELLSEQRRAHFQRIERFIPYEKARRIQLSRRWQVALDPALGTNRLAEIRQMLAQLPVDVIESGSGLPSIESAPVTRRILVLPAQDAAPLSNAPIQLQEDAAEHVWKLCWHSPWDGQPHSLKIAQGFQFSPLSLKARDHFRNNWEFPQAGDRLIVGCHLGLGRANLDIEAALTIMRKNPDIFFVFIDVPGQDSLAIGARLAALQAIPNASQMEGAGARNAVYLGARPLDGSQYPLYANLDAFWLPPIQAGFTVSAHYQAHLVLSAATARPLVLCQPSAGDIEPLPYQFLCSLQDPSLKFLAHFDRRAIDREVLDRWLAAWSPAARFGFALRCADGFFQEFLPRPDFALIPPAKHLPKVYKHTGVQLSGEPLRCALVVETLDKGGLEEVVALLALKLPEQAAQDGQPIQLSVYCLRGGGAVAERLKSTGVSVLEANGDLRLARQWLNQPAARPHLLNTHFIGLDFLQIAAEAGLPVVDTIHNTYVWYDPNAWERERKRPAYVTRWIAVSDLVKKLLPPMEPLLPLGMDRCRPEWG